jgi:hypothetical protein
VFIIESQAKTIILPQTINGHDWLGPASLPMSVEEV